jgi:hypothetical protein
VRANLKWLRLPGLYWLHTAVADGRTCVLIFNMNFEGDTVRFCLLRGEQAIDIPYVLVHINTHNEVWRQIGLHPFLLHPRGLVGSSIR